MRASAAEKSPSSMWSNTRRTWVLSSFSASLDEAHRLAQARVGGAGERLGVAEPPRGGDRHPRDPYRVREVAMRLERRGEPREHADAHRRIDLGQCARRLLEESDDGWVHERG